MPIVFLFATVSSAALVPLAAIVGCLAALDLKCKQTIVNVNKTTWSFVYLVKAEASCDRALVMMPETFLASVAVAIFATRSPLKLLLNVRVVLPRIA